MGFLRRIFGEFKLEMIIVLLLPILSIPVCLFGTVVGYFAYRVIATDWQKFIELTDFAIGLICMTLSCGMWIISGVIVWMVIKEFPHKLMLGGIDWWSEKKITHNIGQFLVKIINKIRKK